MESLQERIEQLYLSGVVSRESVSHKLPIEYVSNHTLTEVVKNDLESTTLYTTLLGPSPLLDQWCSFYTTDLSFLKQTQKCIRKYKVKDYTCESFRDKYYPFIQESNFIDKYQYMGFKFLRMLNESPAFLHSLSLYNLASPILSLLSPLMMLILPFMILKIQNVPITISGYIEHLRGMFVRTSLYQLLFNIQSLSLQNRVSALFSLFIYGLQVYQNTLSCLSFYRNITRIYQFLMDYQSHLKQSILMAEEMIRYMEYSSYAPFGKELLRQKDRMNRLLYSLGQITPCETIYPKVGQIGLLMSLYYDLFMIEENHHTMEYSFFLHDFNRDMRSIRRAVRSKRIQKCTFGEKSEMKGMYYLPHQETKIRNNVNLAHNLVISGPNASGKTTLLKATCLNAIFSQQFGYGCYTSATILCYDSFHSYLNIPDTSGRDSLFQAEARRCKDILDEITRRPTERHLCIFDEIYSGTNPNDAVSCAKLYLRGLNGHKSSVDYLITTHYTELCESFQKDTRVSVKKMSVREKEGQLEYDYTLVDGISYIHGGLYILKQLNYPASLYESV